MQGTIQKWGNSQGIRIPKKLLEKLNFKENEVVELKETDGNLLIKKSKKKYNNLSELFEGYNDDYKCSEFDLGEDVGREKIW